MYRQVRSHLLNIYAFGRLYGSKLLRRVSCLSLTRSMLILCHLLRRRREADDRREVEADRGGRREEGFFGQR